MTVALLIEISLLVIFFDAITALKTLKYFTQWSELLTFITLFLSNFSINLGNQKSHKSYLSPCLAWKWFAFFFQAAFVYEIIVVSFYWIVLYPYMSKDKAAHLLVLENADHIFPFLCLLIEYLFLNSVPFIRR